jgi:hypothetical protein
MDNIGKGPGKPCKDFTFRIATCNVKAKQSRYRPLEALRVLGV